MALLCSTTCGTPPVLSGQYYDCVNPEILDAGANHFILQTCNLTWTDILDPTEWAAKKAAGTVELSPPGVLTIGEPEVTRAQILGCGQEENLLLTYLIDYETYFGEDTLNDWVYWFQRFRRHRLYRIMTLDCAGIFKMETNWAQAARLTAPQTIAGQNPGYVFDVTRPPHRIEGEGRKYKWTMQFRIQTGTILGEALLPGVPAVL